MAVDYRYRPRGGGGSGWAVQCDARVSEASEGQQRGRGGGREVGERAPAGASEDELGPRGSPGPASVFPWHLDPLAPCCMGLSLQLLRRRVEEPTTAKDLR